MTVKLKKCGNCYSYFGNGANNDEPFGICLVAIPKCLVHYIDDHNCGENEGLSEMMKTSAADESHCHCWRAKK